MICTRRWRVWRNFNITIPRGRVRLRGVYLQNTFMKKSKRRSPLLVFLILSLIAASSPAQQNSQPPAKKPKLVLAIVVDQFRYDYLLRFRTDYHSGLARLLSD